MIEKTKLHFPSAPQSCQDNYQAASACRFRAMGYGGIPLMDYW